MRNRASLREFFRTLRRARPGLLWAQFVVLFRLHPSGLNHQQRREARGFATHSLRDKRLGVRRGVWGRPR